MSLNRREFASLTGALALGFSPDGAGEERPVSALVPENGLIPSSPEPMLVLTWLLKHYPSSHWRDPGVLEGVLRDIQGDLARGRELSRFPLENGDGPSPGFRAMRFPATETP